MKNAARLITAAVIFLTLPALTVPALAQQAPGRGPAQQNPGRGPAPAKPAAAPAAPKPPKLAANGETVEHVYGRGLVASANGRMEEALKMFTLVIDADPTYPDVYSHRAVAYYGVKQYDKAIADFNTAISQDDSNTNLFENRGITFLTMKKFDKALSDYDRVTAANPGGLSSFRNRGIAQPLYGRGLARLGVGDVAGGYGDIQLALKLYPDAGKYYEKFDFKAPPPAPNPLPPSSGQLPVRFQDAITDNDLKNPLLVQVTLVDDNSKAKRNACLTSTQLLKAVQLEMGALPDPVSMSHVKTAVLENKTREFHFSKPEALAVLKQIPYATKDMDAARAQLKTLDVPAYESYLPGYRIPANQAASLACAFVEAGKQVRMKPEAMVLP